MIIRPFKRENPYAQIDKRILNDDRLSWKAKGVLAYLLSKPDKWTILAEDLIKRSTDGRDAVRAAMKELKTFGYASLQKTKTADGAFAGQEWFVYEIPRDPSTGVSPVEEATEGGYWQSGETPFPSLGAERRISRPSENPAVGKSPTSKNDSSVRMTERDRERAPRFIPPTIEECRAEAKKVGLPEEEGDAFFDRHSMNGWIPSGQRTQMKDWNAAMRTWKRNYLKYGAAKPVNGPSAADPSNPFPPTIINGKEYPHPKNPRYFLPDGGTKYTTAGQTLWEFDQFAKRQKEREARGEDV